MRFATILCAASVFLRSTLAVTDDYNPLAEHTNLNFPQRKPPADDKCPPCFNCMLPIFNCKQFSECNEYTGKCECIDGFGGDDCSQPLCGALSKPNDKRPVREEKEKCQCEPGWGGINCNVCQEDSVCDAFMPSSELKGTCYKFGMIVNTFHQGCDVTNEKIVAILKGKKPQVTFSCEKSKEQCNFQFWIDQMESFYCQLNKCAFEIDLKTNSSHYNCEEIACKCIPDRMLCGEAGSIDISDFLTETITGPGDFSCDLSKKECRFSEPSMNDLISSVFGDPYITLKCNSGECLHYSEIPGYDFPDQPQGLNLMVILGGASAVALLLAGSVYAIAQTPMFKTGGVALSDDEDEGIKDLQNYVPASFTFENVSYNLRGNALLKGISGMVKPGEMLAIMGGSGAGKTTLLDILALKNKNGEVNGTIKVNGFEASPEEFSKIIGYVDQENHLLPTLTVYETVLNSALLRLPRAMSFASKQKKVYQVLEELRIFDIKDRIIGNDFQRGISGGEKRRVSIACELVTSPSILFLDEPTSGLDSNNANNVIECLVRLTREYNRTLIFSIHQPRSNIVSLFDRLVLLSHGELIYSGEMAHCDRFFRSNGYHCPPGYNIADYLIDITFDGSRSGNQTPNDLEHGSAEVEDIHRIPSGSQGDVTQREWAHLASHRDEFKNLVRGRAASAAADDEYRNIYQLFKTSTFYEQTMVEISDLVRENAGAQNPFKHGYKKASLSQQMMILSSRSFKNIYRNPKLLLGNYILTILLGLFLGTLYYHVGNDISGFQNRLGLFFFTLTYFGFLTLTGLSSFSVERLIFIKERSNNYYSPLAYFVSKIVSDVLPLRVIPPILLGLILYPMVGLTDGSFLKFLGILILFNISISLEILVIGIIFKDLNNSIILSVLVLLASLLFSGLFINTKDLVGVYKYFKNWSVFYYAYESLIINEVKTLILKEKKYGLNIEIPGATILSTFGFNVNNLVFDVKMLGIFNVAFIVIGYLCLNWFVVERR